MNWKLVTADTGDEISSGDRVIDFRGNNAIVADTVGEPPRHENSTGRIYVKRGQYIASLYPIVYDCKWVEVAEDKFIRVRNYLDLVLEPDLYFRYSSSNGLCVLIGLTHEHGVDSIREELDRYCHEMGPNGERDYFNKWNKS